MEYLNKFLEPIREFHPNDLNQKEYFNLLSDYILEERRSIDKGILKLASIFPSETLGKEEVEKVKQLKLLYLNLEFTNYYNLGRGGCWNGYSKKSKN